MNPSHELEFHPRVIRPRYVSILCSGASRRDRIRHQRGGSEQSVIWQDVEAGQLPEGIATTSRHFILYVYLRHEYSHLLDVLLCDSVNVHRKIVKDFTFSNGIVIPAGQILAVASFPMHNDGVRPCDLRCDNDTNHGHTKDNYDNPEQFDGFRFSRMRKGQGESVESTKYQMVSSSSDFVAFGHGRNTW
jgi:hypothetical protein